MASGDDEGAARQELYCALRKCRQHTVRSLSFPSLPGAMMEDGEIEGGQGSATAPPSSADEGTGKGEGSAAGGDAMGDAMQE